MKCTRTTTTPDKMGAVPYTGGLGIQVATVVAMRADSLNEQEILAAYPHLGAEDPSEAPATPAAA
jgi:uncharacterized protein (DUF433 family)